MRAAFIQQEKDSPEVVTAAVFLVAHFPIVRHVALPQEANLEVEPRK